MTSRRSTSKVGFRRTGISLLLVAGSVIGSASLVEAAPVGPAERPAETRAVSVIGLREGSRGAGVTAVQQQLIGFGYFVSGGPNGVFGPGTTAALRVFQSQNGLNPTGVVTENTARYLGLPNGVVPAAAGAAAAAATAPAARTAAATAVVGLRRGASGASVRDLQTRILATGLVLGGGADGMFGPSTERAVKLVQRVNGLPETGVVDARTAQVLGVGSGGASSPATPAPAAPRGPVLQYGSQGNAVRRVQQLLIKAGQRVIGGADGVFGARTRKAVQLFQRAQRLPTTGIVDARTDAALVAAAAAGPSASPAPTAPASSTSGYVGLRIGSVGPAVKKIQQAIMATGMTVRGGADGVFGQGTHNALVVYQRTNGLNPSGVIDAATARLMGLLSGSGNTSGGSTGGGPAAAGFAQYDERGSRVVALQKALIRAGIVVPGGADGMFGSGTAGAIMKFQRAKGLRVTGKVDQATATALGLSPLSVPAPAPVVNVRLQSRPVAGRCWYGDTWQAARGSGRVHLGVDIGGAEGTALRAVVSGRVSQIYRDQPGSLSGNGLKIAMADGTYFFYAHLSAFAPGIALGVPVSAGQVIGYMGRTGNAGITHLHFEVHPRGGAAVNPYPVVQANGGAC